MNDYMQMCFELALKGAGKVSPNPMVGAVIVKDGRIISKGYHHQVGAAHAELDAIENATESLNGAMLYCNLEPCCHTNKRTPPCAQRIVQEQFAKVIISNLDPNPQVAGKGVDLLRAHGVEVEVGVMEQEGKKINEIFFTNMQQQRSFIELKLAQTLDGKIATCSGHSKWITSSQSRQLVHQHRQKYDAIMVGGNTAKIDNPRLTVRLDAHIEPKIRLIMTKTGDLPAHLDIFCDEYKEKTYLVVPAGVTPKLDWQFISAPLDQEGNIDLVALSQVLYQDYQICSVYVEGGKTLHTMYLQQNAFDRLSIFIAPKLMGSGMAPFGDLNINNANDAITLNNMQFMSVGDDLYLTTSR